MIVAVFRHVSTGMWENAGIVDDSDINAQVTFSYFDDHYPTSVVLTADIDGNITRMPSIKGLPLIFGSNEQVYYMKSFADWYCRKRLMLLREYEGTVERVLLQMAAGDQIQESAVFRELLALRNKSLKVIP